jgi:hypothetical protein
MFYEVTFFWLPRNYYLASAIFLLSVALGCLCLKNVLGKSWRGFKYLIATSTIPLIALGTASYLYRNPYLSYINQNYDVNYLSAHQTDVKKHPKLHIRDYSRIPFGGHVKRNAQPRTLFDRYINEHGVFDNCAQIRFGVVKGDFHDEVVFVECTNRKAAE